MPADEKCTIHELRAITGQRLGYRVRDSNVLWVADTRTLELAQQLVWKVLNNGWIICDPIQLGGD